MKSFFDVIVVGGGPAGLMAAKTAAEKNLEVLLIEKRKRIPQVKRTCCSSFFLNLTIWVKRPRWKREN